MSRLPILVGIGSLIAATLAYATQPLKAPNGMYERSLSCHAITGADIIPEPGEKIEDGTIVIQDGIIVSMGQNVEIPAHARVWHAEGMMIYPGFVEPAMMVETSDAPSGVGAHWNSQIRAQLDLQAPNGLEPLSASSRTSMRDAGYTVAAIHPSKGVLRGRGTVIPMAESSEDIRPYMNAHVPMSAGFDRGGWGAGYPSSLMGSIALMRQTMLDSRWHLDWESRWESNPGNMQPPPRRDALVAMESTVNGATPVLIEAGTLSNMPRSMKLAEEFDLDIWILGTGDEYRNMNAVRSMDVPLIIPMKFPSRPELSSFESADRVSLRELSEWEQAPSNLRRLIDAEMDVHVTTTDLDKPSDIRKALRTAIRTGGLGEDDALACITTRPARLLGIDDQVGRLAPGMAAHLVMCDGPLFDKSTTIQEVWVSGNRHDYEKEPMVELAGPGTFTSGELSLKGSIDTSKKSFSIEMPGDDKPEKIKAKSVKIEGYRMWGVIDSRPWGQEGWARFGGRIDGDAFAGRGRLQDGTPFTFDFMQSGDVEEENDDDTDVASSEEDDGPEEQQDPLAGTWSVAMEIPNMDFAPEMELVISSDGGSYSAKMNMMGNERNMDSVSFDEASSVLKMSSTEGDRQFDITATIAGNQASGTASSPFGEFTISGSRMGDSENEEGDDEGDVETIESLEMLTFPLGAYGRLQPPEQESVRIENATIWTCGPNGIVENGGMIVENGKITWAGPMDRMPEQASANRVIDAAGLHVTPGLIDCHSHTGINGGVNEGSEACTAEVRIGDVIDPEDIDWYRQLAGGLTACNQLHGSANPIGGQNSVVKLKWGRQANEFPVDDAIPGIKFALGENVKRSTSRYPNTRMGVESFIRDRFMAARAYQDERERWESMDESDRSTMVPPRTDLELETLVEILDGERLVHCHSYRQDEILALLRTAEDMGFTIGTLQHILEGYKVADAIADHGAGASSFSDWWAYKVEVMDAIPYNGSIMRDVGVTVSFNSDDNELATRMNDEAAKAVRFGGVPRAEALQFVTLNPAKQLRIDHRTGSLEVGKDADFVIWSDDPLSSYSRCLQTWIEGARYWDADEDEMMTEAILAERGRLTAKILADAIGDPKSLASAEEKVDVDVEIDPSGAPTRRRVRRDDTVQINFPYEDKDHRGVCGDEEVSR